MIKRVSKFITFFNTVRHLKFKQVWYRIYFKFKTVKFNAIPPQERANWRWNGSRYNLQSIFSKDKVKFLNKEADISDLSCWNSENKQKLWLYNLHYFDDLNAVDYALREDIHWHLINRWVDENKYCEGNGWEPYPISLRLVNWIKWLSTKQNIPQKIIDSIAQQTDALCQQIEYHILGNHIFANAKALIFAGTFLKGDYADKVFQKGANLLNSELSEQFLEDGAHFELSPMYHSILLWDLLDIINLLKISDKPKRQVDIIKLESKTILSLNWLSSMLHPDSEISFFNDAAIGIAPPPKLILEYAKTLGLDSKEVPQGLNVYPLSGYSQITSKNYKLIFDHANVGPDYLPGHAHADTLSFEMSVGKQRVFVNSGTSLYGISAERLRQRSTPSHNTVTVQNLNSSEVWSGFRVARRAYCKLIQAEKKNKRWILKASHNGYCRLNPKISHQRQFICCDNQLSITDLLSKPTKATYNLYVHPDISLQEIDKHSIKLVLPTGKTIQFESSLPLEIQQSTWHPMFGVSIKNKRINIKYHGTLLETTITVD